MPIDQVLRSVASAQVMTRLAEEHGVKIDMCLHVTEVRQALAEEMLTGTRMKLEEVAIRLGYAEPSSFFAAFKHWTKVSPGEFRKQYRENISRD